MRRFLYICAVAAAIAAAAAGLRAEGAGWAPAVGDSSLIRFHVIANSDSPADQALKLKVRDAVIREMTPVLAGVDDAGEARTRVDASLGLIKAAAERAVAENGYGYPVEVMRGNYDFPEKTYRVRIGNEGEARDLTLPAGRYEAVRVVIGSGRGANWWCVLFPPLCFVGPAEENLPAGDPDRKDGVPVEAPAFRYAPERPEMAECGAAVQYRFKLVDWYKKIRNWELGIGN
ncbi:MAG: stage II sporulation protein R [Peptococcaceae bacterium]|nr:stage II sporulation protein R [Peptococcaceae bacterium]